MILKDIYPCYY